MNLVLTQDGRILEWLDPVAGQTVVLAPASVTCANPGGFAGWTITPDYHDTITELLAAELVLDLPITRVAAIEEFDLLRAGRLRDLRGLCGQSFADALRYRDRWMMKTLASDAGVEVPLKMLVEAVGTLPHRIGEIGLPAVVRPRWMAAATGARVVRDFSDVTEVMRLLTGQLRPFELMVERHVPGQVFYVDGLVRAGSILTGVVSEALPDAGAVVLDDDDWRSGGLVATAGKVVAALGTPEHVQAFHAEFVLPDGGEPVLSEIACRHGGGGFPEMIEALTGLDLRRESLLGQLALEHSPLGHRRHGSSGFVMRAGRPVPAVGDSCDSVREALC